MRSQSSNASSATCLQHVRTSDCPASAGGRCRGNNSFANLLREAGDFETAIEHYRRAEISPITSTRSSILAWRKSDRAGGTGASDVPGRDQAGTGIAKAWPCLGFAERELHLFDDAAASLDRACALDPANARALHARALTEAERDRRQRRSTHARPPRRRPIRDCDLAMQLPCSRTAHRNMR